MKILHSADWHLDSPLTGKSEEQSKFLRTELLKVPDRVAALCKSENCDLLLLAGDLFDGKCSKESLNAVMKMLEEIEIPVFISPGNHDFCQPDSPYVTECWPENVHIFTHAAMESVTLQTLDCTVYGAGYEAMDCPGLLKGFLAQGLSKWHIGLLHSDATQPSSPYCPVTAAQVRDSGLHYLALGHIHKGGSFRAGETLCAWPGCPMGRGYDESGVKGVLVVELTDNVSARFLPLTTPRFFDETVDAGEDAIEAVAAILPPLDTMDTYRITLTGYSAPIDTAAITAAFPHVPNLEVRDRTVPEIDLWSSVGEDTLEGVYFRILQDSMADSSEKLQQNIKLAAKISRQILDGQEVTLP
jgi:DNA repair exonuclease SbcCD nuclease subunit